MHSIIKKWKKSLWVDSHALRVHLVHFLYTIYYSVLKKNPTILGLEALSKIWWWVPRVLM